jgi:ligand-binding sensor domain-containing protein
MNAFYVCKRLTKIVSLFLAVSSMIGCSGASSWSEIPLGALDRSIVEQIGEDKAGNLLIAANGRIYSYNPVTKESKVIFWPGDQGLDLAQSFALGENGDMWIGGRQGLVHYRADIDRWDLFTTDEGLTNNDIRALLLDDNGTLWAGTGGSGLVVSADNGASWQPITIEPGFSDFTTYEIYQDSRDHIWVGAGSGLFSYNPEDERWSTFTDDGRRYDSINQTWLAPPPEGVVLAGGLVSSIYEDSQGRLWFGTINGVSLYDPNVNSWTTVTTTNHLVAVWAVGGDQLGNIWIGTDNGAARYDPVTQEWTSFAEEEGFTDFSVIEILLDSDGNLWFGTFSQGLFRYTVQ